MKNIVTTVLATLAVAACLVGCGPTIELDENGAPTKASLVAVSAAASPDDLFAAFPDQVKDSDLSEDEKQNAIFFLAMIVAGHGVDIEGFTASQLIEEGERLAKEEAEEGEQGARLEAEKSSLRGIAEALEFYKLDNRHYPATEQGLEALVTKPSGFPEAKNWGPEPYLRKYPLDQYENEYFYLSEGRGFELKALGADGVEGGEGADADVNYADI